MESVITIGERKFKQKATAKNAMIYRAEFGEDITKAFAQFQGSGSNGQVIIERLDIIRMMRLVWTMEKTATPETPCFAEWAEGIEHFPLFEVYDAIIDLIMVNLTGITTIKNADAAAENLPPKD